MIKNNIKRLMKYNGYTQKELAIRAGITECAVSRYLSGTREPTLRVLKNLATALGVSFSTLISEEEIVLGFSRSQTIKGLECCTMGIVNGDYPCNDCPYNECNVVGGTHERQMTGSCQSWLRKDALTLVKLQAEDYTALDEKYRTLYADYDRVLKKYLDLLDKEGEDSC